MREKIKKLAIEDTELKDDILLVEPSKIETSILLSSIKKIEINLKTKENNSFKALIYSDNYRVKVLNNKIAGTNINLVLEVDSMYLETGFEIKGNISIVSNFSELKIPYVFTTYSTDSSEVINKLKTEEDFYYIYKEDRALALSLFAYKEFKRVKFLQDLRRKTLYYNFSKTATYFSLEEFLIGIGAKERVKILTNDKYFKITEVDDNKTYQIKLMKNTFGYFLLDVFSDKDFIELEKNIIEDTDFKEDVFCVNFRINSLLMTNEDRKAKIIIKNSYTNIEVDIDFDRKKEILKKVDTSLLQDKKKYLSYLKYRIQYEYVENDEKDILPEIMRIELLDISNTYEKYNSIKILIAETYFLEKKYKEAGEIIQEVYHDFENDDLSDEQLILAYMLASITKDFDTLEELKSLADDITYSKKRKFNFLIKLYLKDELISSFALLYEEIIKEFNLGSRSPFLYMSYIKLLNSKPAFLHDIEELEILSLIFALKNDYISEDLLELLKDRIRDIKVYSKLSLSFLLVLYKKYKEDVFLEVLCKHLIELKKTDESINKYYKLAIDKDIDIPLLYEYYLYSLKDIENKDLDEKILAYFLKNNMLEAKTKIKLYKNIVKRYAKDSKVYKLYEKEMYKFLSLLARSLKINEDLEFLYKEFLKNEDVSKEYLKLLLNFKDYYKISIEDADIKSLIVSYKELKKEYSYNIVSKEFYIPIVFEDKILFLVDDKGNRLVPFNLKLKKVFENEKLFLEEEADNNPLEALVKLKEILKKERLNVLEIKFLENSLKSTELSEAFKEEIFNLLISYYKKGVEDLDIKLWEVKNHELLISINKDNLLSKQREIVVDSFIAMGYFNEAYEMLKKYKNFDIQDINLQRLVEKMILDKAYKIDNLLVHLAFMSFKRGNRNRVLLDFLCKNFNASTKEMYTLLEVSILENIETYDLEERLLSQLLFVEDKKYIDKVFSFYVLRKKVNDILFRAYLNIKANEFLIEDRDISEKVYEYLFDLIRKEKFLDKIPISYKLVLLKHYSKKEEILELEKEYAKVLLSECISQGLEFPFFKDLSKFIDVPKKLLAKQFLTYIKKDEEEPILYYRLSYCDNKFVKTSFSSIYKNLYIKSFELFEDDSIEYRIYDENKDKLLKEGKIKAELKDIYVNERIRHISDILKLEDDYEIKNKLEDYFIKDEFVKKLFDVM